MSNLSAPNVANGYYSLVSGNYIKFEWDTVGIDFSYEIQRGYYDADDNLIWDIDPIYVTDGELHLFDTVDTLSSYNYRIRSRGTNFTPSGWYIAGRVNTFQYNQNSIKTQSKFSLSNQVLVNNLNDIAYPDPIIFGGKSGGISQLAYLMKRGFEYDPYSYINISQIQDKIVSNGKSIVNHGTIPDVCTDDVNLTIPSRIGDKLYAFERWQQNAKVSNDNGVTWNVYKAFASRAGNPVASNLITQSAFKTYALGYDTIMESSGDDVIDFSSIEVYWSSTDVTFDYVDVTTPGLNFKAADFSVKCPLPDLLKDTTESYAVGDYISDEVIVATANGNIQFLDSVNADMITAAEYVDFAGLPKFNDEVIRLVEHSDAWLHNGNLSTDDYNGNPCVRNIVYYNDPNTTNETDFSSVSNGRFFLLYVGDWVTDTKYDSPRFTQDIGITQYDEDGNLNPYIGVYMLNYYLDYGSVASDGSGVDPVFKWDTTATTKLTRIYGNSEYERQRLDVFSAMSRDDDDLIIKIRNDLLETYISNPKYKSVIVNPYAGTDPDDPLLTLGSDGIDYVNDQVLVDDNSEVTSAVKYFLRPYYTSSVKNNQQIIAFDSSLVLKNKPMDYYDSANCIWMEKDNHRDYKSNNNQFFTMFPSEYKSLYTTTEDNRVDEVYTVYTPNLSFDNFDSYADGVLYADLRGRIIGYYKFSQSLINYAEVLWHPEDTMFQATIVNSQSNEVVTTENSSQYNDPNLSTVFDSLGADEYFSDNMFGQFIKYYIDFISNGSGTAYNNLFNMLNFNDPLNSKSTDYLYSAFYLRNTLPNDEQKEQITRFFLSRQNDFYSTKGIEDSYKFLFKMLYNEDVDIEIEDSSSFKFVIQTTSDFIDDSIIGNSARTNTGYGSVNSVRQYFDGATSNYEIELNNPTGKFIAGQDLVVDLYNTDNIYPPITVISSLETTYINELDKNALAKSKSYYTMRIKSQLQYKQYEQDVKRFVHPVGFPFIGVTLITILVNSGISINSTDTTIQQSLSATFDSGIANKITDYVSDLSSDGERLYTGYYSKELIVKRNPEYTSLSNDYPAGTSESDYKLAKAGYTADQYNTENGNSILYGLTPNERRKPYTITFDSSSFSYSNQYRGPLDELGNVKIPNPTLYKFYSEMVTVEDDSNIKEINPDEE